MIKLSTRGRAVGEFDWRLGRISRAPVSGQDRGDTILLLDDGTPPDDLTGYRGIISTLPGESFPSLPVPAIVEVNSLAHIQTGYAVLMTRHSGMITTLYRPESPHNVLFITDRCNSNCVMCSQPPIDRQDDGYDDINLELIRLMEPIPEVLGITGGEPTLHGKGFLDLLRALRERMPDTYIHMLTNGRLFAWKDFTADFVAARHPRMTLGIPLYSDLAPEHDYVVQARGAFDQTVLGIHQLARHRQAIEVRVVIHQQTCGRLLRIARFIYHNLPFVSHVALMGLEMMGYVKRNYDLLWVDPTEYQDELERATEFLAMRGMSVSIYNHQLCLLRPSLWKFARQSISDYKNIYLDECEACTVRESCGGLFKSAHTLHSPYIKAVRASDPRLLEERRLISC